MPGELPPLPTDRAPAVTVVLFDADRPNTAARIRDLAALDYGGPMQVLAVSGADVDRAIAQTRAFPWVYTLAEPAVNGAAIAKALEVATSPFIAWLPRSARPHPLWLDELIAVAVEHPGALGVAPALAHPGGETVAAGVERLDSGTDGTSGVFRARRPANGLPASESELDAVFGDGFLARVEWLSTLAPFDNDLALRELGIDLSLRGRATGHPVLYAPGARVFISTASAGSDTTEKTVAIDPRADLLLSASHNPKSLPGMIAANRALGELDSGEVEALLSDALKRADIPVTKPSLEFLSRTVLESARLMRASRSEIDVLKNQVGAVQKEQHEARVVMHREMAWSHALDQRARTAEDTLAHEKQKFEADRAQAQRIASEEKQDILRKLEEAGRNMEQAERELVLLREQRKGDAFNEARIAEIDRRWRESEERRETALRELGIATERARALDEKRHALEQANREERDQRIRRETELAAAVAREERWSADARAATAEVTELRTLRSSLEARVQELLEGFNATSKTLKKSEEDLANAMAGAAELERKRELADRNYAQVQVELETTKRALNDLNTALSQEQRTRTDELKRSGQEMERASAVISELEDEIRVLGERKSSAERIASELQAKLTESESRVETLESQEIQLLAEVKDVRGELEASRRQYEQSRLEIATITDRYNKLRASFETLTVDYATIESALKNLQKEFEQMTEARDASAAQAAKYAAQWNATEATLAGVRATLAERESELERVRESLAGRESELSAARAEVVEKNLNIKNLESGLAAARAELARTQRDLDKTSTELAEASARLVAETRQHLEDNETARELQERLSTELATERRYAHDLFIQKIALENRVEELRVERDMARSELASRTGDLARLRRDVVTEKDQYLSKIVDLLDEVRRPRFFGRRHTEDELRILKGPGAGFVKNPIRL